MHYFFTLDFTTYAIKFLAASKQTLKQFPDLKTADIYDLAAVIDDFESASHGFGVPQGVVHTGLAVDDHGQAIAINPCLFAHLMTLPPKRQQNLLHNIITYSNKLSHVDDSAYNKLNIERKIKC